MLGAGQCLQHATASCTHTIYASPSSMHTVEQNTEDIELGCDTADAVVVVIEDAKADDVEKPKVEEKSDALDLEGHSEEEIRSFKFDARLTVCARLCLALNGISELLGMLHPEIDAVTLLPLLAIFPAIAGMVRLQKLTTVPRGCPCPCNCCCRCAFFPWVLLVLSIVSLLQSVGLVNHPVKSRYDDLEIDERAILAISVLGVAVWLHVAAFGGYWLRRLWAQDRTLCCM